MFLRDSRSKWNLKQPLRGSTPDTLRLHFGPRMWAWLLQVLAGWLAGRPAAPAGGVADWLAPRALLDSSALGPYSFFFRGGLLFVFWGILIFAVFLREYAPNGVWSNRSGAPHRNHLGSTLGPGSGPVAPGPGWLAGWQAGRPELLAAWLTGWLNGWLAGSLGSPGQLGFGTIFFLLSKVGFILFSGVCSLLGDMESGATE